MEIQKVKAILVFLILIGIIGGGSYFLTVKIYGDAMEKNIRAEVEKKMKDQMVQMVCAKEKIVIGSEITAKQVGLVPVKKDYAIPDGTSDIDDVVGKMADSNFSANQQISLSDITEASTTDLEPDDRYISIDIPVYSFVNNKVDVGSCVDILVDKGNGKYDVVLSKVVIYDKKEISEAKKSSSGSKNDKKTDVQIPQLNPTTIYGQGGGQDSSDNLRRDNPGKNETKDYRVQLRVNEAEQKRLFEAQIQGKFMTRLYVSKTQNPSKVTFKGSMDKNPGKAGAQ